MIYNVNIEENLFTKKQSARLLNKTADNLSSMHFNHENKLPFVKYGKMIFYRVSDLEKLAAAE